jgi:nucleoside-diphosphate-sugar epimerase
MARRFLITGATGFVGSHIAEACKARGFAFSAIARATSDTALLESLGATIYRGDFTDAAVVRAALDGIDVVVHCAAKVGDRGPVEDYRAVNVDGLRCLLEACHGRPLHRFIHMSSLGVYEPRHHYGTTEAEPLPPTHVDGYTQSKVEAERLALQDYRAHGSPIVILRPGFVYGPRDRAVLPKLLERLAQGRVHYLGGDQRALNTIFIANLVDAVFLAAEEPRGLGQVYNLTDGERVTRQRFFEAIVDFMGYKTPHQRLPRWLAGLVARVLWRRIRRAGTTGNPWLTAATYKFLLLNLDFSIDKAKRDLGYQPRVSFDQGIRETLAWYRQKA